MRNKKFKNKEEESLPMKQSGATGASAMNKLVQSHQSGALKMTSSMKRMPETMKMSRSEKRVRVPLNKERNENMR